MIRAKIDPDSLTSEQLYTLVDEYMKSDQYASYMKAQAYYEGRHEILDRPAGSANTEVNNTIVNNFPGYIVDVNVGYFLGNPVAYTSGEKEADLLEQIQEIFDLNDEQNVNMELGKTNAIKGRSYELIYADEEANPRFAPIQPENLILIYNTSVEPKPLCAIRFWLVPDLFEDEETLHIVLYTDTQIINYVGIGDSLTEDSRESHAFGMVPVVEYINNDERQGDFDKVITLVDAYDKVQSDTANDFESFADAFLLIRNMSGTEESDLDDMRRKRAILVDDDGDAKWLVKDVNDNAQENYRERIEADIHRFSLTPNLTDEKFAGNVSGVALAYKLWGLEQNAAQKERKFKKSLQQRLKLISNFLGVKGKDIDYQNISLNFSRNAPPALPELVEIVTKLKDFVSDETLLAFLPFVDDPAEEQDRLEVQRGTTIDLDKFPNPIRDSEYMTEPDEAEEEIQ